MNLSFKNSTNNLLELHRESFLQAQDVQPGTTVVCDKGILWLTQPEDLHDYMLQPGEKVVLQKHSVLIEALSEAGLRIINPN